MNLLKRPNLLDKIPRDKLLHFAIGVGCYIPFKLLALAIIPEYVNEVAIILTTILGVGIEIFQKITKTGQYEHMDAIAVVLGGLFMLIGGLI